MEEPTFDVLALGHALVDVLAHADDQTIERLGMAQPLPVVGEAVVEELVGHERRPVWAMGGYLQQSRP